MALEYYQYVCNYSIFLPKKKQPVESVKVQSILLNDAKEITLSQYNPLTKDYITAHRIKDYRRKTFTLMLLPKVDILFDKVLEGSVYYNECLQHAGLHS